MYMSFYEPDTEFYGNLIERENKLKKARLIIYFIFIMIMVIMKKLIMTLLL